MTPTKDALFRNNDGMGRCAVCGHTNDGDRHYRTCEYIALQMQADAALAMREAGNRYARGEISAGKLAEVLGVEDTYGFKTGLNTEERRENDELRAKVAQLEGELDEYQRIWDGLQ